MASPDAPPRVPAVTIALWVEGDEEPRELAALRVMNLGWMGFGDLLEGRMWLPEG